MRCKCGGELDQKEEISYISAGLLRIKYSICRRCGKIEIEKVTLPEERKAVIRPTIGLFMAVFGPKNTEIEGKLLLVQRPLDIKNYPGEWQLPGGGVTEVEISEVGFESEKDLVKIVRLKLSQLGLPEDVSVEIKDYLLIPAILKGAGDWAFVIHVKINELVLAEQGIFWWNSLKQKTKWVNVEELEKLAHAPAPDRVLSGPKRMYRLCLNAFYHFCPVNKEKEKAGELLQRLY